jgi:hypothetical protein
MPPERIGLEIIPLDHRTGQFDVDRYRPVAALQNRAARDLPPGPFSSRSQAGHISLYAPAAKILFCQDSMVAEKRGTLRCSRGANTWDEAQAKESVKIQAAPGAEIVCSGHGPIVREAQGKFPTV